jgi:hypothetical protein
MLTEGITSSSNGLQMRQHMLRKRLPQYPAVRNGQAYPQQQQQQHNGMVCSLHRCQGRSTSHPIALSLLLLLCQ